MQLPSYVLWKTYARSGQLVVRRPEPADVPEGEVAIYVVARKNEDYVVGAFLSYLEELERGNITVIFGTDGLRDATGIASDVTGGFVTNPATIRTALNRTVWHKDTGSGRGILQYLAATNEQNRSISRLIVFGSEASEEWFGEISQAAASHHVALNVVIVPRAVDSLADFYARTGDDSLTERLRSVVWSKPRNLPPAYLGGRLAQSGAEVILCQRNDIIL